MDGATQSPRATATRKFPTFDWPAPAPTKFFSDGFWAVAFFCAIGLLVSLSLLSGSLCTGIDVNIGCVPIEMTGQAADGVGRKPIRMEVGSSAATSRAIARRGKAASQPFLWRAAWGRKSALCRKRKRPTLSDRLVSGCGGVLCSTINLGTGQFG